MRNSDRRAPVLLLLALAAAGGACQSRSGPSAAAPAADQAAAPATVSPDIWATVDGREIRREAIETAYRRTAQPGQQVSGEEALAAKLNLLDQAITEDIILAKARELNIQLPDSELDTAYNEGRKTVPDDAFNRELASRSITAADMRESVRRDLLAQKVLEREVASKITVSDQDVVEFFNANKAQFNLPEDAYRLAQIVVTGQKDPQIANRTGDDAATAEAAQAKVQMLMERLKGGAPFQELAMDFSEDPESAPRGGDVGVVPLSALNQAPKALRDAVLKMQPGSVSVVGMPGGFTIVAVAEKQAKGQRDLGMPGVRDAIAGNLRARREQLLRTAYLDAARNRATIVNHLARRIVDGQGMLPPPSLGVSGPK